MGAGAGARDWRTLSLEELLRVVPPVPQTPLDPAIAAKLQGVQADDARLILDAVAAGKQAFLLGNSTGTGKTYVALAAIAALKPDRALIVVPNQAIAEQWATVASEAFGVPVETRMPMVTDRGVYATTYAGLRTATKTGADPGQFGFTVFDEVHREAMKLLKRSPTAKLVDEIGNRSAFTVYSTATPAERPDDMFYLRRLGLWPIYEKGAWRRWTERHGIRWVSKQIPKPPYTIEESRFVGSPRDKVTHMARVRAEIVGDGNGVFRELTVAPAVAPLRSTFTVAPVRAAGDFADRVQRGLGALEELPPGGLYRAARINISKRLLDYAKLDRAVTETVAAVKAGQHVAVFVSNVAPFDFGLPEDDDDLPGPIRRRVAEAFAAAGLVGQLPGPVDYMVERVRAALGPKAAEAYSGQETEGKRAKIKRAFQAGSLPVVVATIAAGGTGLSLHDTAGDAPRTQINVGLPWSGKDFSQLIGRTYRLGTRSPVNHVFLLTDDPAEQGVASKVAGKLASMGALVHGVDADTNAEHLAHFSLVGEDTADEDDGLSKSGRFPPVLVRAWAPRRESPGRLMVRCAIRA